MKQVRSLERRYEAHSVSVLEDHSVPTWKSYTGVTCKATSTDYPKPELFQSHGVLIPSKLTARVRMKAVNVDTRAHSHIRFRGSSSCAHMGKLDLLPDHATHGGPTARVYRHQSSSPRSRGSSSAIEPPCSHINPPSTYCTATRSRSCNRTAASPRVLGQNEVWWSQVVPCVSEVCSQQWDLGNGPRIDTHADIDLVVAMEFDPDKRTVCPASEHTRDCPRQDLQHAWVQLQECSVPGWQAKESDGTVVSDFECPVPQYHPPRLPTSRRDLTQRES